MTRLKSTLSDKLLAGFLFSIIILSGFFYLKISNKCNGIGEFDKNSLSVIKKYAIIEIDCGEIIIEINEDLSPNNTKRFLELINSKEYNNTFFYKVIRNKYLEVGDLIYGKENNLDYLKIGTGGSKYINLDSELNSDFNFSKGSVGMVRRGKFDTENSQFFILIDDDFSFNFQYTPIGRVISDLNLLKTIKYGENSNYVLRPDKINDTYIIN